MFPRTLHVVRLSLAFAFIGCARPSMERGAAGPRTVEHFLRSPDLPATRIHVSAEFSYLGVVHYAVSSGAQVEEFVFADTGGARVRRAFVAHFEGYPEGVHHTFQYPRLEMASLGAHEYLHQTWAIAQFSLFEEPAVLAFLRQRGLTVEPSWLVDRYVRVVDSSATHEVIFFYLEAASIQTATIRYGGAPVAPPPPPTPPAPVTAALRAHAAAAFQVTDP